MGISRKWLVLWSLWATRLVPNWTSTVRVSGGTLRGRYATDGSYAAYFAVPYASFTRNLRFQAPGPEPTWDGVHNAIDENVRCPQRIGAHIPIGQEDCLTMNIYTPPNTNLGPNLPVMVFIHGGGFYDGSASRFLYGPEYLVAKKVILVTINYRLNIQGFLCLRIKEAPGNAGLKDQVAALRWIQKNIKQFGGDPENVTIFGESAGASSVSFHLLSPMSKGLFQKAILQSGSSLSPWAFQIDPVYLASLLAKVMGLESRDPLELYNYYMNKTDADLVITRVPRQDGNIIISELLYAPCVESHIEGIEAFLTENPIDLLRKGQYNKVPLIVGTNNEEGILFLALENSTATSRLDFRKSLPKNLHFPTEDIKNAVADKLQEMYMGDDKIQDDLPKFSKYEGEPFFNYPSIEEAEIIYSTSDKPVFSYLFKYDGKRNLAKIFRGGDHKTIKGATHADELFYLFKQTLLRNFLEDPMTEKMTTLWTNFAKYGDPTPEITELLPTKWEPLQSSLKSLVIDTEFSTAPLWYNDRLKFWKELYSKYRRKN